MKRPARPNPTAGGRYGIDGFELICVAVYVLACTHFETSAQPLATVMICRHAGTRRGRYPVLLSPLLPRLNSPNDPVWKKAIQLIWRSAYVARNDGIPGPFVPLQRYGRTRLLMLLATLIGHLPWLRAATSHVPLLS